MPLMVDTNYRNYDHVTKVSVTIGDEVFTHNFGRRVSMSIARAYAQHALDVMTGRPSTFSANEKSEKE